MFTGRLVVLPAPRLLSSLHGNGGSLALTLRYARAVTRSSLLANERACKTEICFFSLRTNPPEQWTAPMTYTKSALGTVMTSFGVEFPDVELASGVARRVSEGESKHRPRRGA